MTEEKNLDVSNYTGEWIAVEDEEVIAHGKDGRAVLGEAREKGSDFRLRKIHEGLRIPFVTVTPNDNLQKEVAEDFQKTQPEAIEQSEKPETVALEKKISGDYYIEFTDVSSEDVEVGCENELIRRSDAEEYYGKREGNRTQWEYGYDVGREEEHQQIIEMLEKKIQHRENRINSYWKTIKNSAGMARKTKYDIGVGRIKECLEAVNNNKVEISTFKEMIDKLKGENDG